MSSLVLDFERHLWLLILILLYKTFGASLRMIFKNL